jgi:16S rRNA (guanine527-N7)-methyltransferase
VPEGANLEPPPGFVQDAAKLGVGLDDRQFTQLRDFASQLHRWNARVNLLSRRDISRLWVRHVLDSLSIATMLRGERIMDFGTGGGFPGIPLAIAEPEREFTLVDRHARKCRFVEQVAARLQLTNVLVHCRDVRPGVGAIPGTFDTVTCRAVAQPQPLFEMLEPLLAPDGRLVVMAATRQGGAGQCPGAKIERVLLPGLDQSHEVVIIDRVRRET